MVRVFGADNITVLGLSGIACSEETFLPDQRGNDVVHDSRYLPKLCAKSFDAVADCAEAESATVPKQRSSRSSRSARN